MKITVDVNINTAPELTNAILSLATAMAGFSLVSVNNCSCDPEPVEETKSKSEFSFPLPGAEETAEPNQDPEKTEPETEPDPAVAEAEAEPELETEQAPVYTLEQVRAKLAALSQAGKQAQVKKLIAACGVNKLTGVPVGNYANLMAAAEEL